MKNKGDPTGGHQYPILHRIIYQQTIFLHIEGINHIAEDAHTSILKRVPSKRDYGNRKACKIKSQKQGENQKNKHRSFVTKLQVLHSTSQLPIHNSSFACIIYNLQSVQPSHWTIKSSGLQGISHLQYTATRSGVKAPVAELYSNRQKKSLSPTASSLV